MTPTHSFASISRQRSMASTRARSATIASTSVGWNAGMYELASGAEVLTYYDHLMHRDFLPSGRVRYLPMSEYDPASHDIVSLTTAERTNIDAATLVDASYMKVSVPSQRPPSLRGGRWCALRSTERAAEHRSAN